jgi:hypothetical protein
VNEHDLPHAISMRVTDVGTAPSDRLDQVQGDPPVSQQQRQLSASTVTQPTETQTYKAVFTEHVYYGVEFTLDKKPFEGGAGKTVFNPTPSDTNPGEFITGKVYVSGEFSWVVCSTENSGPFEQ